MKKVIIDNITFIHDDCMNVMKDYSENEFDLAIVDPPYFDGPNKLGYYGSNINKAGVKRSRYNAIHWDLPDKEYFTKLFYVSKQQIVWGCNYFDYKFSPGRIVWDKVNGNSSFSDCEIAYCSMINSVRKFTYMWNGMFQGKSIIEGHIQNGNKKNNENRIHPTQKPVKLYEWLLNKYAKKCNRIIDTHGGSMSIAIACHKLGYELTIIEKDEQYFDSALQRFKNYYSQQTLF